MLLVVGSFLTKDLGIDWREGDEHLREPWRMDPDRQRELGCVIGEDYPAPIVDHRHARREAIERYRQAREPRKGDTPDAGDVERRGDRAER
ncbi:MAG TPA: FAD-binding domain-containing protein [Solirubrobacteraceae bacterium]|nr:FAD-binding domain-containing protein [Solirubrobacteraceae bacterium]